MTFCDWFLEWMRPSWSHIYELSMSLKILCSFPSKWVRWHKKEASTTTDCNKHCDLQAKLQKLPLQSLSNTMMGQTTSKNGPKKIKGKNKWYMNSKYQKYTLIGHLSRLSTVDTIPATIRMLPLSGPKPCQRKRVWWEAKDEGTMTYNKGLRELTKVTWFPNPHSLLISTMESII